MTHPEGLIYAIYESDKHWHRAIKMNLEEAGPHFITLNKETEIIKANGTKLGLADCHMGDRLKVERVTSLDLKSPAKMDEGPAVWPARPTAKALNAIVVSKKDRLERLAVVMEVKDHARKRHYRFYDPFTMTDRPLQKECQGDPPKNHALIKVAYVKHEAKTWMDQFHKICMPHDYPGQPENLVQQRGETYEPIHWKALSEDESKLLSRFLMHGEAENIEPALVDDLLLAGAASMQASMRKETTLENNTIVPSISNYDDEFISFEAEYVPTKTKSKRDDELTKAARVLKEGQQIMVAPAKDESGLNDTFTFATIKHAEPTMTGTIKFEYEIPTPAAERLWTDVTKLVDGQSWIIKAAPTAVLTLQFRHLLQQRGITSMRAHPEAFPSVKIIEALMGRTEVIRKPDEFHIPWLCLGDKFLTHQQAEAVGRMTETEHPLNVLLAPAGSGKTTTITAIVVELIKLLGDDAGIIVTANMNVAVEGIAVKLAELDKRIRVLLLQSATHLSGPRHYTEDPYHHWRLPVLLEKLAKGEIDPTLDRIEVDLAKKAAQAAKYRYRALDIDWTAALRGADEEPGDDDFMNGVKLLIKKYRPQVIIGTTGTLKKMINVIEPFARRVICDESGTVATIEMVQLLAIWKQVAAVMLVGDIKQLGNFAVHLDKPLRKFGFDSVLFRAAAHPHVGKTILTEVYRSHPAIVEMLSRFAYADTPLKTEIIHVQRDLMQKLGIRMADPKLPIIVVDCSAIHQPTVLKSFTNPQQVEVATQIAALIASRREKTDVRLMTLYSGIRDDLRKTLKSLGIEYKVAAIDASQGEEAEISIVATAFTPLKDGYDATTFAGATERITVAISRAQHGLILLANVSSLRRSSEWARLFDIIKEISPGSFVTPADFFGVTPGDNVAQQQAPATSSPQDVDAASQQALALSALGLEEEALMQEEEPESRKRAQPKPTRQRRSKSKKE